MTLSRRAARTAARAGGAIAALLLAAAVDCHGPEALGCLATEDPACVPPTPCAGLA